MQCTVPLPIKIETHSTKKKQLDNSLAPQIIASINHSTTARLQTARKIEKTTKLL